jgi:hypothetical protein
MYIKIKRESMRKERIYEKGDNILYLSPNDLGTYTGTITEVIEYEKNFMVDNKYMIDCNKILTLNKFEKRKLI